MKPRRCGPIGMGALLVLGMAQPATSRAEDIEMITHYPEAYGVYEELETAGPAELAIWGGKVGVGLGNPRGSVDVAANAAVSQAITVGNVSASGGATWRLANTGGRFVLSATQDLSGGAPLETLTATRPDGYVGIGDFSSGGLPRDHLAVKGGMVIGAAYAGEARAGSGDLMVEGRAGIKLNPGQLPHNKLDVAGAVVIGDGLAGIKTVGPGDSLAVQTRMGIGTMTVTPPTRLAVAGPVVIGDGVVGAAAPGGADLTVSGTILTPSKMVVTENTITGTPRVQYGLLSDGRYGGEVLGNGTSAGAESVGGAEKLFVAGSGGRIFEASSAAPGTVTVLNTLSIDTTAQSVTIPIGAKLHIPDGARNDYVFVSDGSGKGRWVDPLTLDTNADGKPDLQGPPGASVPELTTDAVIGLDVLYADAVGGAVCNPSDLTHFFKGGGCGSCGGALVFTTTDVTDESGTYGPSSVDCPDDPAHPGGPLPNDSPVGKCWDVQLKHCTGW